MDGMYLVEEVAARLRLHPESVRRMTRLGKIKAYRAGWKLLYSEASINTFLETQFKKNLKRDYPNNPNGVGGRTYKSMKRRAARP